MNVIPSKVPNPGEWLEEMLTERHISIRGLARAIGRDASLVTRWVSKREQIPRVQLAEIARQVARPEEFTYVLRLKDCEDFADRLGKEARALAGAAHALDKPVDGSTLEAVLLSKVFKMVEQEGGSTPQARAEALAQHLVDAEFSAANWRAFLQTNCCEPLVSAANIERHLRYPINHFVGVLMGQEALRQDGLISIRQALNMRSRAGHRPRQPNLAQRFVQQHAIHLLACYGETSDREKIRTLVHDEQVLDHDPMARQLGFMGLLLVDSDSDTGDRYLHLLQRDGALANASRQFDAVHYGDAFVDLSSSTLGGVSEFSRVIPQVLRHLEQPAQYQAIAAIEVIKLTRLLEDCGKKPFQRPSVIRRLRGVIHGQHGAEFDRCVPKSLWDRFLLDFSGLLDQSPVQPVP